MKLKEGFLLRKIAGRIVVVPTGDVLNMNLMISLNETGQFLWEMLEKGATVKELEDALTASYNVSEEQAKADVAAFVGKVRENGFLE